MNPRHCNLLVGRFIKPPFSTPNRGDHIVNHDDAVQLLFKPGRKFGLKLFDDFARPGDVWRVKGQAGTVHYLRSETASIFHVPVQMR
jgi:hypothetical protein